MNNQEVTEQILGAWDEIVGNEGEPAETPEVEAPEEVEPPLEETPAEDDETVEEDGEEEDAEEPAEEEEEGDEQEEEEEQVVAEYEFLDSPEAKAWFDRYQGDPAKAWKGAWEIQKAYGRQSQDKGYLERKVREMESEVARLQAFAGNGVLLSEEQRNWVGEAVESGNPTLYVQEAIRAQQFDLARAVCQEWGDVHPLDAMRAMQVVDYSEMQAVTAAQTPPQLDQNVLLDVLTQHFPEMPEYADKMVETITDLGPEHPLVADARSSDPETAARGVIGLYEIARASSHTVSTAREGVRNGKREQAATARRKAVVASAESSPSPGETPRSVRLGPGLTLEQLDAEWERNT